MMVLLDRQRRGPREIGGQDMEETSISPCSRPRLIRARAGGDLALGERASLTPAGRFRMCAELGDNRAGRHKVVCFEIVQAG